MDRKMILSILAAALLGFFGMLLMMPDPIDDGVVRLPWQIAQDADGRTQVLGFTLGKTTLAEVRAVFQEDGEMSLFRIQEEPLRLSAEAYFEQIYLERLRADFVLTVDATQELLAGMYDRGLRISQLESGSKKVKLDPLDVEKLIALPIRAISYLPKAKLDEALLERRFGTPARTLTEPKTGIAHWLYPDRGLDIGRDAKGHVVIQYVNPSDFSTLLEPLEAAAQQASAEGAVSTAD